MPSLHNHRNSPLGKSGANPRSSTDASYERNHRDTISQNPHRSRLITAPRGRDPTNPQVIERRPRGQEPRDSGRPPPRAACAYLQDAVAVACVAEVLEAEVALALGELVAEGPLELGEAGAHDRPPVPPPGGGAGEGPQPRPGRGAGAVPLRGRRRGSLCRGRSRRLRHARVPVA